MRKSLRIYPLFGACDYAFFRYAIESSIRLSM